MTVARIGERLPLAFRFAKILSDLVLQRCGSAPPGTSVFSPQAGLDREARSDMSSLQSYLDEQTRIASLDFSPVTHDTSVNSFYASL